MKKYFLQTKLFRFTILQLLVLTISCASACIRKSGKEQSTNLKIFFFKGSYHVTSTPPIQPHHTDMSMVGCMNLAKPTRIAGEWTSREKMTGECVAIYHSRNCQPPRFDPSLSLDEFNSFHLCSWKALPNSSVDTSKSSKKPTINIFGEPNKFGYLNHYYGVEKCTNLIDRDDKKVVSVETFENCFELYENKDCLGASLKLKGNDPTRMNLANVGWANKTSSIKPCGMYFQARVTAFRLTSNMEDFKRGGRSRKIEISGVKFFENNGTQPIFKKYEERKIINETFQMEAIPSFSLMDSVQVERNLSIEPVTYLSIDKVDYPQLCLPLEDSSAVTGRCVDLNWIQKEVTAAYQFQSQINGSKNKILGNYTAARSREFSSRENLTLPQCSVIEVRSFIQVKEDIPLEFELGIRLSGENLGKQMTAEELRHSLPRGMTYLKDLGEFEIFAKTSWRILATVGLNSESEIRKLESNSTGCTSSLIQILVEIFFDNLLLVIIGGIFIFCCVLICFVTLCFQKSCSNSQEGKKEFEVIRVGGYMLIVEFICCPPCEC